jgi:hypothetical protein
MAERTGLAVNFAIFDLRLSVVLSPEGPFRGNVEAIRP